MSDQQLRSDEIQSEIDALDDEYNRDIKHIRVLEQLRDTMQREAELEDVVSEHKALSKLVEASDLGYMASLESKDEVIAELRAQVEKLREGLEGAKRGHRYCDDSFYSCPLSEDGCSDDGYEEDECNCGADAINARIDALLADTEGE